MSVEVVPEMGESKKERQGLMDKLRGKCQSGLTEESRDFVEVLFYTHLWALLVETA